MLKKCVFFPCVFLCVFVLSTSSTLAQKGPLSLSPASIESLNVGEPLEFSLNITGGQNVAGYQVTLQFDTSALAFDSSENGDYLGAGAFFAPPRVQGNRVELVAASGSERQGAGTLAKVTFKVKTVKASKLTLVDALLSNRQGKTAAPQQLMGAEITKPSSVRIPDAALANAIRKQLGLPANAPITKATMQGLRKLSAPNSRISDLTGLERATNLLELNLWNNQIRDITPLQNLTNLQWLDLRENQIRDITPLQNLTNLQQLYLWENLISDITPLQNLTNLQTLYLRNNRIRDITPLQNLIKLQTLGLRANNQIRDITPLQNLTNLQVLSLGFNQISDIQLLENLTKLQRLYLQNNQIRDITPLQNLTNLQQLELHNNQISDVTSLAALVNLELLYLKGNPQLRDTSPLADLHPQLKQKDFEITGPLGDVVSITDPALRNAIRAELGLNPTDDITTNVMLRLTKLEAAEKGISDLTGLEHATNLEQLFLHRNQIQDIIPLENLKKLHWLSLSHNQIQDITPLENLKKLRVLSLGNNQISDIQPFENLTALEELFLRHNRISNLQPLKNLTKLQQLGLMYNQISDVTPLGEAELRDLYLLYLKGNPLGDTSSLADLHKKLTHKDFEITDPPKGTVVVVQIPRDPKDMVVDIPDTALANAIRDELGLNPTDDITKAKMRELTQLSAVDSGIRDITGLEHATNLQTLNLGFNQISDLTPLKNLIQLEKLDLTKNQISDLTPLKNLIQLENLPLGSNQISDVTPLAGLTKLRILYLGRNRISNIQSIENLIQLEFLFLYDNQISDVTPLAGLTKLLILELKGNPSLRDTSPLADLKKGGTHIDIEITAPPKGPVVVVKIPKPGDPKDMVVDIPDPALANAIRTALGLNPGDDITRKAMLTRTMLNAVNLRISNLTGLEHATNLQWLYLRDNQISDIKPLQNLTQLQELGLYGNQISDIKPLQNLTQLRNLYLSENQISDIKPLQNLTQLQGLHLYSNQISDIKPLQNLTQLRNLYLEDNQISDIKPLQNLTQLRALTLSDNQISDIQSLENLTQLQWLRLRENQINDVTPLAKLVNLTHLYLAGNPQLRDTSPLADLYDNLIEKDFEITGPRVVVVKIPKPGDPKDMVVDIPDTALANAIRAELGLNPTDDITTNVMLRLTKLEAGEVGISDLTGLEYATNLRDLALYDNQISDIKPLQNLTNLQLLYLFGNQINDIKPLQNLTQLQGLGLQDNQISDVTPLVGLVKLQELFLAENPQLRDTSPLADLEKGGTYIDIEITAPPKGPDVVVKVPKPGDPKDMVVDIPDTALAGAIRSALGLKAGDPITAGAMQTLTLLEVEQQGISDLTGLEHATNLQQLFLWNNNISDITPLQNLTNLQLLYLQNNQIRDLKPLENLTQLRGLNLSNNQINDIKPLQNLTQLQWIRLEDNQISDVTPLVGLVNLHTLYLARNPQLRDTSPLADLHKKLTRKDFEITDPPKGTVVVVQIPRDPKDMVVDIPDPALANAIRTQLRLNPGDDITKAKMQELTYLSAVDSDIRDITGLEHATNLWNLSLSHNQINDIQPLKNLIRLRELSLFENQISDIQPLENLTQLQELSLSDNQISDIQPLENLTQLQGLSLEANEINDITPLEDLTQLQGLGLSINQISDIQPLENLTQLQRLGLSDNQISDIQPLENLTQLQWLHLRENQINDVTPLAKLVNLTHLYLAGNPQLQDTSPLADLYDNLIEKDFEITQPRLPADVNNDGIVNISDLVLVAANFGKKVPDANPPEVDVNGDGIINIADLVLVAGAFGAGGGAPILDASILDMFTAAEVGAWLSEAQHLDTTDPVSEKGIRFLAQLLAVLTPRDTLLLPNYPNPFNPETWIPYHLAAATEVQITIYDATGRIVRRLDLGYQPAGYYTDRSRAAYWDGRNALGEPVASGVYFYTLTTGNFSGTKKMLIRK